MTNEEIKLLKNFITWQSLPFVDNLFTHEDEIINKFDEWLRLNALEQQPITWIVGKDNCQVAVRNMSIDKMQKICAIIGNEELVESEDKE